jgi:Zn-dependent protease with chaperone function
MSAVLLIILALVAVLCTAAAGRVAHVNPSRRSAAAGITFSLLACSVFWILAVGVVLLIIHGGVA